MLSKLEQYATLVSARKACEQCAAVGLTNPAKIDAGAFDSSEIGPWTRWNGDLNARIMVIGQEWGDVASFRRQCGNDAASSRTNEMLSELLEYAGIPISPAPQRIEASGVFMTNAALCLKVGGAQSPVKNIWFTNCGASFLKAQVELVQPRVVVTLGERAYCAIRDVFNLPRVRFQRAAIRRQPIPLPTGISLVPVYHCGQRILNTHRNRDEQFEDWALIKKILTAGNHKA